MSYARCPLPALPGLLLLLSAACGGELIPANGSTALEELAAFRVLHYDYAFALETRAAHAAVELELTSAGGCVALDLRPEIQGEVLLDGVAAREVHHAEGKLVACAASPFAAGDRVRLETSLVVPLETWTPKLQVGFSIRFDPGGQPFTYLQSWVEQCDRFGPCDKTPGTFATYRFTVTHPSGTRVLCPGTIEAGETTTVCSFDHAGGPTYSSFAILASPAWKPISLGTWGTTRVTLYDLPGTQAESSIQQRFSSQLTEEGRGFLAFMEENFGPYPYGDELRLVMAPLAWGGFEHPGNIALSLASFTVIDLEAVAHTMLHELAHQWAGNQTTIASRADFVWKESMAEYLAYVYTRRLDAARAAKLPVKWKDAAERARNGPIPDGTRPLCDTYTDAYGSGPLILFRQLEARFGEEAILAAIRSVLGAERALSIAELEAALSASTGADLSGYFEVWLHRSGAPAFPRAAAAWTPPAREGAAGSLAVELTTADGVARGGAFSIRLIGDDQKFLDVPFAFAPLGATRAIADLDPGFEVRRVVVDPLHEALVFQR